MLVSQLISTLIDGLVSCIHIPRLSTSTAISPQDIGALQDRKVSARDEKDYGDRAWPPTILSSMVATRLHSFRIAFVSSDLAYSFRCISLSAHLLLLCTGLLVFVLCYIAT